MTMGGLANGAIPAELEAHDDRLRDLEVEVARMGVNVEHLQDGVASLRTDINGHFAKLMTAMDASAAATKQSIEKIDARLVPLEKSVSTINAEVELAKTVGLAGLKKFLPWAVAAIVALGASPLGAIVTKLLAH